MHARFGGGPREKGQGIGTSLAAYPTNRCSGDRPVLCTYKLLITLPRGATSQEGRHTGPYGRGLAVPERKTAPRKGFASAGAFLSSRPVNGGGHPERIFGEYALPFHPRSLGRTPFRLDSTNRAFGRNIRAHRSARQQDSCVHYSHARPGFRRGGEGRERAAHRPFSRPVARNPDRRERPHRRQKRTLHR